MSENKGMYTVICQRSTPLWRGGKKWQGTTRNVDAAKFTAMQWAQILAEPLLAVIEQAPPAEPPAPPPAPPVKDLDDEVKGKRIK